MPASLPSHVVSPDAIATVAGSMPSLKACVDLAAKLGFSQTEIMKINTFDEMTAQHVLNKWYSREAENATGQVLYDALCAIGLKAVAKEHTDILLGKDE